MVNVPTDLTTRREFLGPIELKLASSAAPKGDYPVPVGTTKGAPCYRGLYPSMQPRRSAIERLVSSVRQKEDHIILMAREGDVSKLLAYLPWLQEWGFQSKENYQKNTTDILLSAAEEGWANQAK